MLSPKEVRHLVEEVPLVRHDPERPFRKRRYSEKMEICPEHPALAGRVGESPKDGMSSAVNSAAGHDELKGAGKVFARNLRKARGYFLEWRVFDVIPGKGLPTGDPEAAKTAIGIVNEKRFDEFALSHSCLLVPNWEAQNKGILYSKP